MKASDKFKAAFGESLVTEDQYAPFRQEDGRFIPGTRGKVKRLNAQGLSRALRRYMRAEAGSERVYYEWLFILAKQAKNERVQLDAILAIADRVDGKVLASLELSTPVGKPLEVKDATPATLTSTERLAAVAGLLRNVGALSQPGPAGGAGPGPHPTVEQVPPEDG